MTNEMTAKEAVKILKYERDNDIFVATEYREKLHQALDKAINALEQGNVLDKIREEILDEAEYAYADFDQYKEDILHAEPDELPDDDFRYGLERAVEIINKYKAESRE